MNKDKTIEKRAGFTPGPWTSDWVGTKPNAIAVVWLGENTNKRLEVFGGRDEANARLIAQAPAMYEQCKLLERMLASGDLSATHDGLTNCNMLAQLRELLANVDGGDEG